MANGLGLWRAAVQYPLQTHILSLERKLQHLRERLVEGGLPEDSRQAILAEVQFTNDALAHYRKAYELECIVMSDDEANPPVPDNQKQ